jgi:PAS domain S-box-containing protein
MDKEKNPNVPTSKEQNLKNQAASSPLPPNERSQPDDYCLPEAEGPPPPQQLSRSLIPEGLFAKAFKPFDQLQREETLVQPTLKVVSGSANQTIFYLGKKKVTIGRAAHNDLILEDSKVSRSHATVNFEEGEYIIEDLNSTNGVYVDGKLVRKSVLKSGNRIALGESQLVFTQQVSEMPSMDKTAFINQSELVSLLSRETTADLLASEEKYKALVENVPLVVYRLQADGKVMFTNQFVEEIFGYSPSEICSNPDIWAEIILEDDLPRVQDLRKQCIEEGKEFLAEYRIRNKNGQIMYLVDHAIPYRGPRGEVTGMDGIIMDMTGPAKLQEKALRAEELKTLREVSSRLAHEIRNPLVSAGGFARRLVDSLSPNDPNRYKAEIIVKEMSRLELILRMVLTYIQPVELKLTPTELNRLIETVLANLADLISKKNVKVHSVMEPGLPLILADPSYMERVFDALLKNALFQMPEAGALNLSTAQSGDTILVNIRYSVEHMSQDDVDHFFFPFTTPKMQSVAADLSLSRMVLYKLGGDIKVSMEKPGALRIYIVLPIGEA